MTFLYKKSKTALKKYIFSDPSHCHLTAVLGNTCSSNARRTPAPPVGNRNVSCELMQKTFIGLRFKKSLYSVNIQYVLLILINPFF